jgi:CubicO group peptidase (beta-lactamase class C family)
MDTTSPATTRSRTDLVDAIGLGERLQQAVESTHVVGASLAIWRSGRLRVVSAGWANLAAGIAADDDTIFQIGSITKVFTATLVIMLAEQGLIDPDTPVSRYLPDLHVAGGYPPDSLTVRTLLDHTSGVAGDFFADFGSGQDALGRYVAACADLPLLFAPGTMRGYSSTAYCIAGRIVEVVTGEPFDSALERRLLRPLGMERFAFFTHDVARYRTAIGHLPTATGFAPAQALRLPHALSASGSSLTTTATDLLRFGLMHLREGTTESGARLLTPASCRAMIGPSAHVPPGESPVRIGWANVPLGDGELICASGETANQNAFVGFNAAHDLVIAILANTSGGAARLFAGLGCDLIEEATGARPTLPTPTAARAVDVEDLERYCGNFTNHTRVSVQRQGNVLAAALTALDPATGAPQRQDFALTPIGDHRFVAGPPEQPAALFEFLFADGPDSASHMASAGRIYARCDADGKTRWH